MLQKTFIADESSFMFLYAFIHWSLSKWFCGLHFCKQWNLFYCLQEIYKRSQAISYVEVFFVNTWYQIF